MSGKLTRFSRSTEETNIALILSFCSMSYEFTLARIISDLTGMPIVWQPITIGVFLLGLGIGGYLVSKRPQFFSHNFSRLEFILALVGGASVTILYAWHIIYRMYYFNALVSSSELYVPYVVVFAICAELLVLLLGVLTGFELPVLLHRIRDRRDVSFLQLLFWYQLGVFFAVAFFYMAVMSRFEMRFVVLGVGALNLSVALYLAIKESLNFKTLLLLCTVAIVLLVNGLVSNDVFNFHLKNFYYNKHRFVSRGDPQSLRSSPIGVFDWKKIDNRYPDVKRVRTRIQNIDVTDQFEFDSNQELTATGEKFLHLDRHFQFSYKTEADYHQHMAFVGLHLFQNIPSRILVLGAGDGLLVRELLKLPSKGLKIDLVEIDRGIIDFAIHDPELSALNQKSLLDKRVQIFSEDAFWFLRNAKHNQYDAVYIDFPYPFTFDAAKLFSVEFLQLVKKVASHDAIVTMDTPFDMRLGNRGEVNKYVGATVYGAGYYSMIAFQGASESFVTFHTAKRDPMFSFFSELETSVSHRRIPMNYFSDIFKARLVSNQYYLYERHSIFQPIHMFFPDPRF